MVGELVEEIAVGRPSEYTQEKADLICAMISEGCSIRTICAKDGMPSAPTFFKWLRENPEFLKQYTHAKQEQAEALIEDMLDIADDATNDWMERRNEEDTNIGWTLNGEHVQRSRLRIETRKWLASKLKPKKYGEKLDVDHTTGGEKINYGWMPNGN